MSRLPTKKLYTLDPNTIAELVERYRAPLTFFAVGFLKDVTAAEDAVSDAIVKLLIKKPSFQDENALKTYLYKTTKTTALDHLRKRERQKKHFKSSLIDAETDLRYIEDALSLNEQKRKLTAALTQVQEHYREVLYLHYFEELSITEICKITNKNKKHIYNLLARAKTALFSILKKEGIEDEIER